jgi:PIN domain nuclease of toxin-antitoxin system
MSMMRRLLADTHALLWFLAAPHKLGRRALRVFTTLGTSSEICVSAITLWEVAVLHDAGKLRLSAGFSAWHEALARQPGVRLEPLTSQDVEEARSLRQLVDPFDRLIAGTALRLGVPLISKDQRMAREKRLRLVW